MKTMEGEAGQGAYGQGDRRWSATSGVGGAALHGKSPQASAARPDSQAERSVLHPDQHDPEWRYYHGAWGG